MFAIVRLGNQQFKVKAGDFIRAPFQEHSVKDKIEVPILGFDGEKGFTLEKSQLKSCKVKAVITRQTLGKKLLVFKKKRRKGYRKTQGHRQKITELKILELCSPEGKISRVEWTVNNTKAAPSALKKDTKKSKVASDKSKKNNRSHKKVTQLAKVQKKAKATSSKKSPAVTKKPTTQTTNSQIKGD